MVASRAEQVLSALYRTVKMAMPAGVVVVRNAALPARVPAAGWVCIRDGDPGSPQFLHSPALYIYDHEAEVDLVVDAPESQRDARFDALRLALRDAIASDRTLGGLCDYVVGSAPEAVDLLIEGSDIAFKAATVGVVLTYETSDPLG